MHNMLTVSSQECRQKFFSVIKLFYINSKTGQNIFSLPPSSYLLVHINLKNMKYKTHAVFSSDVLHWENPIYLFNCQMHAEAVICYFKTTKQKGVWSFIQCRTIFVQWYLRITLSPAAKWICFWPFFYLPSFML